MAELGFPIVATRGNLSDEPICIDEHEALQRLHGIADVFLVHDRPIVRHVDDSIVRMAAGREMLLRRARGYAPMPVPIATPLPPILAVGAHLKNSVALSIGQNVFISQHIGDLATFAAHEAFRRAAQDLPRLYEAAPAAIACDQHPEYLSTKYAAEQPTRRVEVQHHWAHVLSCAAENELHPPYLGVAWDGTGYATDGTIWGGEFLCPGETVAEFERVAHLRPFRLPGGESAIRQPGRAALGLLQEMEGPNFIPRPELAPLRALSPTERALMTGMVMTGLHAPLTSSAGRLFDAVAALLDLRQRVSFEGEAAMALEFAAQRENAEPYPFQLKDERPRVLDWAPTIDALLRDLAAGKSRGLIAARFHQTLVEMILAVARAVGEKNVVLTGGCFQNVRLLEATISRLESEGFHAYWHQQVPPNDGGISLGQVIAAAATLQNERSQPGREVALS
jgi:hydrogenase maturation protein HypF